MYLFSAESPNFSAIPLKIAPLFGGEAALKDVRCGKSRDFRETFQWGQEAISLPWTIVKRLLYFFQEGIRHFVKVGPLLKQFSCRFLHAFLEPSRQFAV